MTRTNDMTARKGATLVEVLIAIFVMAIGLMALMALFPLGAFRMSGALQDSRASQVGNAASALATARTIRQDSSVLAAFGANANKPLYIDAIGTYGTTPTSVAGQIPRC